MENSQKKIPLKSFENFQTNSFNKNAFRKANEFTKNNTGLFISGTVGSGKTHLAKAAYNLMIQTVWTQCEFIETPELLLEIRETFKSGKSERDLIDRYTDHLNILFLDDFGAEKTSDFTIEILYLLLSRWEEKLETKGSAKLFITSNFSLDKISESMSDRIASRISGICEIAEIQEKEDWRLKKRRLK